MGLPYDIQIDESVLFSKSKGTHSLYEDTDDRVEEKARRMIYGKIGRGDLNKETG